MGFIMHVWANSNFLPLCLLGLCFLSPQTEAGEFSAQIKTAYLAQQGGWYMLEADVAHILSPVAREAIQSSIPLVWCLKVQLKQIRYFHDKTLVNMDYRYKIRYHALLNSYSVTNMSTNTLKKYATLSEALDALSRIRELKVLPVAALKKNRIYEVAIKLEFDKEQLPAPLRPVAYFNSDWDLSSDWYLWPLKQ
jgi:hypothetical protein